MEIPTTTLTTLSTNASGPGMRDALTKLGWKGNLVATVCLSLSPDGSKPDKGGFNLWGPLSLEPIEFPASRLWEGPPRGTTVRIGNLRGQAFQFPNGHLQREYTDGAAVDAAIIKSGQQLPQEEWAANAVGNFALRAFAHLDKNSNRRANPLLKVTVLAVPLSPGQMTELSDRTQHPSWPGLKVLETQAELFPAASNVKWGCPILPILQTRDREATSNSYPTAAWLRYSIASIFRTAALPTACVTRGALNEKGQQMLDQEEEPEVRHPTISWPAADQPALDRGNFC